MTDRDIMKQALDALEGLADYRYTERVKETMSALTERLAHCDRCGKKLGGEGDIHTCTPPQRKPLTDDLYNELLFAVARVHPNETRHQTALRYIQQAESGGVDQREACAKVCEDLDAWNMDDPGSTAAEAIRART
jgi:hypothetical protein